MTKSYDCAARKHAWEFAKATLPERGSFKSAYEALQLDVCGVPTPAEDDVRFELSLLACVLCLTGFAKSTHGTMRITYNLSMPSAKCSNLRLLLRLLEELFHFTRSVFFKC